ncbi:polymorphic toxin-type HINT domain-containing protein [Frigidibacter sp. SD6-1]|uniref:polymorphic toxin-type HINT domain-containing protein n=1 Tax=Frigidibacter sp. SD6-1 TaxID=3032581 RepID=UPI0024DF5BDB|nr:polymorphic toxin-type HINT domain-containing protein [Frigidibacter sp. SD6-1]
MREGELVTALMGRQAMDVVWLGLEASGQSSRLGVTAEHPLYVEGRGWVQAGELAVGDRIVDADGGVITVVSRELDATPRIVHNLEIAGAHTYFAGELEAWGHNSRYIPVDVVKKAKCIAGGKCEYCGTGLTDLPGFPNSLQFDHIDSYKGGGTSKDIRNIACACRTCNLKKGTKSILDFFKLLGR